MSHGRKSVIVTGADSGIGLCMSRALLNRGYKVAALDISSNNIAQHDMLYCAVDVSQPGEVERGVEQVLDKFGAIDILVNNACVAVFGPFLERSIESLRAELDTNLFGCINTIRAVLPHMQARGTGIIWNVSSMVGITGFSGLTGYTMSKGAIESLSRTLTQEVQGTGVHVGIMHPPLTRTASAMPLGVPQEAMARPEIVGERLAAAIESGRSVVTTDFMSSVFVWVGYRHPRRLGSLLAQMTKRGRSQVR